MFRARAKQLLLPAGFRGIVKRQSEERGNLSEDGTLYARTLYAPPNGETPAPPGGNAR